MVSKTLNIAVMLCGPNLGFYSNYLSACYLRAAGAMAILYLGVDSNIIKLIGRWRSYDIPRYLHVQA